MAKDVREAFSAAFVRVTEPIVFGHRRRTLLVLLLATVFLGYQATQLKPDAGFEKQLPLDHPYIQVFKQYQQQFGGANLVLVAAVQKQGDIYEPRFMESLRQLTDEVFFLPGIDRGQIRSLFTPNTGYVEIVEGGFSGGPVVPAEYQPTPEMMAQIRENVGKAQIIGRLVSNDQSGAMVMAELQEYDPITHEKLDYTEVAKRIEEVRGRITSPVLYEYRAKRDLGPIKAGELVTHGYVDRGALFDERFSLRRWNADGSALALDVSGRDVTVAQVPNPDYNPAVDVHVIGFAKVVGDVSDATLEVVSFFGITLLIVWFLLWQYCGSMRIAMLPLGCAILAVVWELGLLRLLGFGLDPFAILVPFLILAVAVSHGVQITSFWLYEVADHGRDSFEASRATYRRLVIPGITALLTNVAGFGTILLVPIDIIQEMALNACLGCLAIIVTKKVLLPCLLSYAELPDAEGFRQYQRRRDAFFAPAWRALSVLTERRVAVVVLAGALVVYLASEWIARDLQVGELHAGVPELRPDSRYNRDSAAIVREFAIGVDVLKVMAETGANGCIDHHALETVDEYAWHMRNTPGVQSVLSLPYIARYLQSAFNEGSPKWRVLSRNRYILAQTTGVATSTGLLNADCSVMPVLIFTVDHKATTIDGIIAASNRFTDMLPADSPVRFALASGNVGVMAATNDVIKETERPILFWVYLCIAICVWMSFRTFAGMACVLVPLALVSMVSYAVMAMLDIGVKVATLPVAAFAAGIGVDYGIYIYSVLEECVQKGMGLREAYQQTLHQTGKAVLFTGLSLAGSVCTWMLSDLQFQVDMGILLTLMFLANAVAAVVLLPAFAAFLMKPAPQAAAVEAAAGARP